MSNIETGGPVHPVQNSITSENNTLTVHGSSGLTLRDYFAAQTLTGALCVQSFANDFDFREKAVWVYAMADAMLEARK